MTERDIFIIALRKEDPGERRAYLDEACAGRPELRHQVEHLLRLHDGAGSFLEKPAATTAATGAFPETAEEGAASEVAGTLVGPYKLIEPIGEGGMGTVWMVQQTEPVKRLAALKLIKPAMDSREVIARFEAERQALALMDHPNIARVFDGGTVGSSRPYFVMELVKGVPITTYCDEQRLTPRERLELFVPVCQAIQHAHQKGIIHRDIKPSNVLVALCDGKPMPKVIDFGVAKATGQRLTEQTLVTGFGAVVGTLEYMSPEQAELNQPDVDTRSDIYSLGVVLYELLAGTTPLDRKRLKETGMLEVLRLIREEEPPRPSTRLSEAQDTLPAISARRHTEPAKLTRLLRGELDWIVMKALEKDRNRRYETANGLARDVQRYLADEPVQACPPSAWYRCRKFVRRNKAALVVAAGVFLALAGIAAGIGWAALDRATRQARLADQLELALERAELFQGQGKRAEALAALERAQLLAGEAGADPARQRRLTAVRDRLDAEARDQQFMARFEAIRLRDASRVNVKANHFNYGQFIVPQIREALHGYGIDVGVTPPAAAAARIKARPEPVRLQVLAALDECLLWAGNDRRTRRWLLDVLSSADDDAWRRQARLYPFGRRALKLAREVDVRKHPPSFLITFAARVPLEVTTSRPVQDRPGGPERRVIEKKKLGERLELYRRIQDAYPGDLWANVALGNAMMESHPAEATRYLTAAIALRPNNPGLYYNRGIAHRRAGERDRALADYRKAVTLAPEYEAARLALIGVLRDMERWDEVIRDCRAALARGSRDFHACYWLGIALREKKHFQEAERAYRTALAIDPRHARAHEDLGIVLYFQKRVDEAIREFRAVLARDSRDVRAYYWLGIALRAKKQFREAERANRMALALDPRHHRAHVNLGAVLHDQDRVAEAIREFRTAIALEPRNINAHKNLALVLRADRSLGEGLFMFGMTSVLDPRFALSPYSVGVALLRKRQLLEAAEEMRTAAALESKGR